ncbi:unnamed protein product [Thlaspi arvense]|uniref:Uncharacterized protein n=1 Tax=Thlaspi arvense TaxID=13288 RepID=A0AAU9ST13_THLAR|nr:unnamed protein product [Thlaspi arvense]
MVNYTIINSGLPLKLQLDAVNSGGVHTKSMVEDILTDIKRVGDLAISTHVSILEIKTVLSLISSECKIL